MSRILYVDINKDLIQFLASYITSTNVETTKDFSNTAIIFGGKRPALFLKRAISRKLGEASYPPVCYSIEEFIKYVFYKHNQGTLITHLDACALVYRIAKDISPDIVQSKTFPDFINWAGKIVKFIEHLDVENVNESNIRSIGESARIGYDVPNAINKLLANIIQIRKEVHSIMIESKKFTYGLMCLKAMQCIKKCTFPEFDNVIFTDVIHMRKTEKSIIENIYDKGKAYIVFQGFKNSNNEGQKTIEIDDLKYDDRINPKHLKNINIYKGYDGHSQIEIARKLISNFSSLDDTVVVLPEASRLVPLLSELSSFVNDINVSMGYPIKRSSLYGLLKSIYQAQHTMKNGQYYVKDYLKVILHPIVKNLTFVRNSSVTRILIHKIEETLRGISESEVSGCLFFALNDLEKQEKVYQLVMEQIGKLNIKIKREILINILKKIHLYLFKNWENILSIRSYTVILKELINLLIDRSMLEKYPLNIKVLNKICDMVDVLSLSDIIDERYEKHQILKLVESFTESEKISFTGTPLKGLQILGFWETRNLSFKNVIILDVNEGMLPKLSVSDPLIPVQIIKALELLSPEVEDKIQRYHFMRLVSSAENVHMIFNGSEDKESSRYLEQIVWEKEKLEKRTGVVNIPKVRYKMSQNIKISQEKKSEMMIDLLHNMTYSASSLDTYLKCPMRFYYKYVLGLKELEDIEEDIPHKEIGTFIHSLLEKVYENMLEKPFNINKSFRKDFMNKFNSLYKSEILKKMHSESFMVYEIMKYRFLQYVNFEAERNVDTVLAVEEKIDSYLDVNGKQIKFKCIIDRIDRLLDGSLLILDYKTGMLSKVPKSLKYLKNMRMERKEIFANIYSFQLPVYFYFIYNHYSQEELNAALYLLVKPGLKYFLKQPSKLSNEKASICLDALKVIINEILSSDVPFIADGSDSRYCNNCPFILACKKR